MILFFSGPIGLILIIIFLITYPRISNSYRNQIEYSLNQSCEQAAFIVNSYGEDMSYVAEKVAGDYYVRSILKDEVKIYEKTLSDQYRDFIEMSNIMDEIELTNAGYRVGVYVNDQLMYAHNYHYFFPMSELEAMTSYDIMQENLSQGKPWVEVGYDREYSNADIKHDALIYYKAVYKGAKPAFVVRVSMDLKDIKTVLKNASITKQGMVIYYNNDKKRMLTDSGSNQIVENINLQEILKSDGLINIKADGIMYAVIAKPMEMAGSLVAIIPQSEINSQTQLVVRTIEFAFIAILLVVVIVAYFLSGYYVKRLKTLSSKMKDIQSGDMSADVLIPFDASIEGDEITQIYSEFNYMFDAVKEAMKEHYKMGKNIKNAQLKALQAQINPHFLYNTLDLMNWMAMDYGAEEIAELSRAMAQFFRLSLNHGKELLTVAEEIKHVKSYIDIQNYHFDHTITASIDVPEELLCYACPNIILQPFVENSIVHGMGEHPEITSCHIKIGARQEGEDILLWVTDDGPGIAQEALSDIIPDDMKKSTKGYGAKNINFRLKLYFGEKYGVNYESGEGGGTTVYVRIPMMKLEEMENIIIL